MTQQHPPLTKADRQVLALQRKARRYPKVKKKIDQIRKKVAWIDYLSK